jgi:predicted glycosyltransferase
MKKILFYCQYLTGMGHLVRSTEIIRALVQDFQICFVNGGPTIPGFELPASVEVVKLPPLWIENGQLQVAEGFQSIEEVKESRKNQLIRVFDTFQPDCLITEFFPFGRHKLFFELIPLLDHIKAVSPATKIVCSVRDIVGRTDLAQEEEIICQLTSRYFDLILFHSDPNFQKLEESFSRVRDLNCEVKYTGFVAQSPSENLNLTEADLGNLNRKEPMILVSVGGGRLGYEVLETVVEASPFLRAKIPHQISIFTGPFMPEEQFVKLQQAASHQSNVKLQRYTSNLMAYMKKAELSISLTGYNTTMNILQTGVRSLVVPIGHYHYDEEQLIRTKKLEKLGIVEVIEPSQLEPNYLAERIRECVNKNSAPTKAHLFDLEGAKKTAVFLQELLQEQALVAA